MRQFDGSVPLIKSEDIFFQFIDHSSISEDVAQIDLGNVKTSEAALCSPMIRDNDSRSWMGTNIQLIGFNIEPQCPSLSTMLPSVFLQPETSETSEVNYTRREMFSVEKTLMQEVTEKSRKTLKIIILPN